LNRSKTYVGFGFGAIQAGLFLYEAQRADKFRRLVVAEVVPKLVSAVRTVGGGYWLNVAHSDRIEPVRVRNITIENPNVEADRERLIDAVAEADEIGTAVPSVSFYAKGAEAGIHRILAAGLLKKLECGGPPAVVYAAENHNHAAEILEETAFDEIPESAHDKIRSRVCFVNTVIGKMSGVITDPAEIEARELRSVVPEMSSAFLVESFNRILISRVMFDGNDGFFDRGISVFEERENLLPFEEAKLYGHNATHALAAYLGKFSGVTRMADLVQRPELMDFLKQAFVEESGAALIRKHGGVDPLFTPDGYQEYVDDLLERMVNPYLGDEMERVGRDPGRKLGWNDRLTGTMRVALSQEVTPVRYSVGAAAALAAIDPGLVEDSSGAADVLLCLWKESTPLQSECGGIIEMIKRGLGILKCWRDQGFTCLEQICKDEKSEAP
jgi:mannitol-1-phosphate 5-dehydrogenase